MVAKPLNMNAQVMHQYILGSSQTQGAPIYQYRAVYGNEQSTIQIGSDLDMNTDGYARHAWSENLAGVAKWQLADQGKSCELQLQDQMK